MIEKLTMKNVASYNEEGVCFENLSKINIIYGGNGTGKTTISNYLSDIENLKYKDCECEWNDYHHEKILVYNKKFREDTILNVEEIPGVFTLGEENVTLQKEIKTLNDAILKLKNNRNGLERDLARKKKEKEDLNNEMNDSIWDNIYKKHPKFDKIYIGYKTKEKFKIQIENILDSYKGDGTSIEELEKSYDSLYSQALSSFEPINIDLPINILQSIEDNPIFTTRVLGKKDVAIAELVNKLNISDWVFQGKNIIEHSDNDVCPFCQQHTITKNFKKQIEEYFDQSFLDKIKTLNCYKNSYSEIENSVNSVLSNLIEKINTIPFLHGNNETEWLKSNIASAEKTLSSNVKLIDDKIKEPGDIIKLDKTSEILRKIAKNIDSINEQIDKNNFFAKNQKLARIKLSNEVWQKLAAIARPIVTSRQKQLQNINKAIEGLEKSLIPKNKLLSAKEAELNEKESNATSIVPTITSINDSLSQFGFTNFKIIASGDGKTYYKIQREDGTYATDTLSEGEQTFISFLYYMNLVKGSSDITGITDEKILVIDDPVSSLDSDILFVVSSLLKELFKEVRRKKNDTNIKQVILLTHNVYFHKEVSFIDKNSRNENTFWILRKNKNGTFGKYYGNDNPIKSSYELLWADLRAQKDEKLSVSIQNIMRKILETYFTVFGDYDYTDRVLKKIKDKDEKEIARSLLCWVNEGSHIPADDVFVALIDDQADRYMEVFRKIFDTLGQIGHYNMMMRIDDIENKIDKL